MTLDIDKKDIKREIIAEFIPEETKEETVALIDKTEDKLEESTEEVSGIAVSEAEKKQEQLKEIETLTEKIKIDGADKVKPIVIDRPGVKFHMIKKGDTLYSLSKKYGISIKNLKEINKIEKFEIEISQKLYLE